MKKSTLRLSLRRSAAFLLAAALSLPTVRAAAGEQKLQTSISLTDGLTYRNTVTLNRDSRVESFSLELAAGSQVTPILIQGSGSIYGAANINRAVSRAQEAGWHVLGAVNTDFFSLSTGIPIGISIEDGVYRSSPANESALVFTDGVPSLCQAPVVGLTLANQRTGALTVPHYFNKLRQPTGGLYLLNHHFSSTTRTSQPGWYVRMMVVPPLDNPEGFLPGDVAPPIEPLTVNSTLTLEVVEMSDGADSLPIGEGEYILTANSLAGYSHVYDSFQLGDRVTLTTSCHDPMLSAAQWACGAGDLMIQDGSITDSAHWTYTGTGRAPRTALGVKGDGSMLLYVADGRQSGYSMGLTQADLAQELLDQGCQWAVNLDGGGSSALSAWLPGQAGPAVQNSPSEGWLRGCATYLLLVTRQKGDGQSHRLALKEEGLTVLAGSSLPLPDGVVLDSGLNLLDAPLEDLIVTSQTGLGGIADGIYTAGSQPGTDTLLLRSPSLGVEGTAQIHVVDSLTDLTLSRADSEGPLSGLSLEPEEQVQLTLSGSYWSRTALRDLSPALWTVTGDVGTVDETGLFTAASQLTEGSVTVFAGGLERTIPVSLHAVYRDVPTDHWAHEAVAYCYGHGIVSGVSPTEFGLDRSIRRADFVLMLYGALGRPAPAADCTFTDVFPEDYYYAALSWGQEMGLISGVGEGRCAPLSQITREQAFTILRHAMSLLGKACPDGDPAVLEQFVDKDQIADYAKGHTATLAAQGLLGGGDGRLEPKRDLTRAEMAVLLHGILTYTPILDGPNVPEQPGPETPGQPDPETPEQPGPETPEQPGSYAMSLNFTDLTLASGESAILTAAITPQTEGVEILWTSSSPTAAAVSPAGLVTNLFPGTGGAVATVTASWGDVSASCQVNCLPAQRTGRVVGAPTGLFVRSGPGTEYTITGGLDNGTQVVVLGEQDGWYQVLYLNRDGQAALGYSSGQYLEVTP